jgi:hypothetical protein
MKREHQAFLRPVQVLARLTSTPGMHTPAATIAVTRRYGMRSFQRTTLRITRVEYALWKALADCHGSGG